MTDSIWHAIKLIKQTNKQSKMNTPPKKLKSFLNIENFNK